MTFATLVRRSLAHYWRTNLAVVLGVATAVAVLAGALLVGHSVRASLRDLVEQRLGATDLVIAAPQFFREQLAADIAAHREVSTALTVAPIIVVNGVATAQESGRRAGRVKVYGVGDRFWAFHKREPLALDSREVALSAALAKEIGAEEGTAVLVRVERPSDIPLETLHSRKDDVGRTLRLTTRAILPAERLGDFALDAQQGDVFAVFVPLSRLQQELEVGTRVNTILLARMNDAVDAPALVRRALRGAVTSDDVGLTLKSSDDGTAVIVGSSAGLLDERQQRIVANEGSDVVDVFTYLANTLRVGDREVPYSLVTGRLPQHTPGWTDFNQHDPGVSLIVLNAWLAEELHARQGDRLSMDYYVWEDVGRLATRQAEFVVAGVVPMAANGADLAPEFPGISNTPNLSDWDPPFPLDLRRVRKADEDYWDRYRATPKAFVDLATAQRLWGSRYGALTSVRVALLPQESAAAALDRIRRGVTSSIDAESFGLLPRDLRAELATSSQGATDFGEYFVYFSFFLVVSALVLVVLFFKLGIEQRVREVGLLRAVGVSPRTVRRLFATEGVLLAVVGSVLGAAGAVGYASLLITLLTTRWLDAVGTTALRLHVSVEALAGGAVGGVVAAAVCIWVTLRRLQRISERSLLAGEMSAASLDRPASRAGVMIATGLIIAGLALVALAASARIDPTGGFFGAGALLLIASLMLATAMLRRRPTETIGSGAWPTARLAARNASYRPARTVLAMAVLASATFILVTVDAFRRDGSVSTSNRNSGTGGYQLMVRTLLPIVHDPNSSEGRDQMNLVGLDASTRMEPFRLRPGDDASCLNLYQPTNPRILAPRDTFLAENRFVFASSAATTDAERANPWLLLNRSEADGAIPVIGDANSMTYVLHRAVGDELTITNAGAPVTLRFVAALRDSIFQSEVLMSEGNFRRLFPSQPGYQLLLVDTPGAIDVVSQEIEQGLGDAGGDAINTSEYLASFHRVENTYLSTFQTLGGLGLLLGTVGLATVLLRNVLERRREFALLTAVGYRQSHFLVMAVAENLVIVVGGLAIGAGCAVIAIAPAVVERGARIPLSSGALLLLFAVFVVAMVSSVAAMAAATKTPLLEALRSE